MAKGLVYEDDVTGWRQIAAGDLPAGSSVSSLDTITGAITLIAGSGVTIQDNTPGAGQITIGSTGGGGTPAFVGARIYNAAAQTVTTATNTNCVYNTTDYSNGITVDLVNGKLTAVTAGYYLVQCAVSFVASATGVRQAIALLNGTFSGTGTALANNIANAASSGSTNLAASAVVHLAVGDFITGGCRQTSGGNLNTNTGSGNEFLSAALIGV
jgi:hypothetical protein